MMKERRDSERVEELKILTDICKLLSANLMERQPHTARDVSVCVCVC